MSEEEKGAFTAQNNYLPAIDVTADQESQTRYLKLFPENAFSGKKIGVYQHSGVARELLPELLEKLGAEVVKLGYSEQFIPVDTEAVRPEDVELAKQWTAEYPLFAIISPIAETLYVQ